MLFLNVKGLISTNLQNSLIKFACDVVEDEIETNPDIRNIAIVIGENKFSNYFVKILLKHLPKIPQILLDTKRIKRFPEEKPPVMLQKETMILYIADIIDQVKIIFFRRFLKKIRLD